MFTIDTDKTISITRGDSGTFVAPIDYALKSGDVLRLKVFRKKACEDVVLQKDFAITEATNTVSLELTTRDTRFGDVISKPVDYWYEIELNPFTEPQTLVGYDEDGAKILRLYPEGKDLEYIPPTEEEIGTVDKELSLTSERPIQNQAVAREFVGLKETVKNNDEKATDNLAEVSKKVDTANKEIAELNTRVTNFSTLKEGSTTADAELLDIRVGGEGTIYPSAGEAVRGQFNNITKKLSDSIGDVTNNEIIVYDVDGDEGIYNHNVSNGIYKVADGVFNSGVANARSTDKIPVKQGEQYTLEGTCTGTYALISEFDENQNWIASYGSNQLKKYTFSSVSPNQPYIYTVPEGVSYVAFSTHNTTSVILKVIGPVVSLKNVDDMIANEVNPIKTDVTRNEQTVISNEGKTSNAIGTVTYLEDITNKLTLVEGRINGSNGTIATVSDSQATLPFEVSAGEVYHIWGRYSTACCVVAWYDDAQEFISGVLVTGDSVTANAENELFVIPETVTDASGNERTVKYMACSTIATTVMPLWVKKEITEYNNVKDMVSGATEDLAATKLNKTLISPNGSEWVLTISNDGTLTPIKIRAVGEAVETTLTLPSGLAVGTYTLKYEGAEGVLTDYADICSLDVTALGSTVSYNGLIAENCASEGVTSIGVYNSSDEKVSEIDLGFLNTQYSGKLYSFAALSDVHIGDKAHFSTKLEYAMDIIDDTDNDISFTVICGDMVDDASDVAQLETYQSIVKGLNKPVYVTMGNHETINILNAGKTFDDIKLYFKQDNYDINQELYFSFSPEGSDDVFIMFGISGIYSKYEALSTEQLQWLYETLEENRNKRCFLFHHYFPYDGSGDAIDCYDQNGLQGTRGELFYALLKHYKNVIYFHGHSHAKFKVQELNPMNTIDNIFGRYSVHIPSLTCPTYPNAAMNDYIEDSNAGEGYIVEVYENGIALRGLDFENGVYSPIGSYYLDTITQKVEANSFKDSTGILNKTQLM